MIIAENLKGNHTATLGEKKRIVVPCLRRLKRRVDAAGEYTVLVRNYRPAAHILLNILFVSLQ
jgi:hypothetical protein